MFTNQRGEPVNPESISQLFDRKTLSSGLPRIRHKHDLRHAHGSLLIKDGIPVKVVSERLGHANIAYTMQTYQHILPGMQADAARAAERLTRPVPPPADDTGETRRNQRRTPPNPEEHPQQRQRPRSLTWAFALSLVAGTGFEPVTFGL
jgi:integrase